MRVPNQVHVEQPWRIHAIAVGFTLEDVWQFPGINGAPGEFDQLICLMTGFDPGATDSFPARSLWRIRDTLGRLFDLGRISTSARRGDDSSESEAALVAGLDDDLIGSADGMRFEHLPFRPLYKTADEFAAHLANATVHAVMHLAWAGHGDTRHCEMAVYVKPNGLFGRSYMAFIKPFRYLVVYPALERQFTATWSRRGRSTAATPKGEHRG